jgi:YtkA-like
MSTYRNRLAALVFGALLLAACSSAPAQSDSDVTFPLGALTSSTTDTGALKVEVRTSPQPPAAGNLVVELTLTDPAGAPKDGLVLSVVPWMPAMGHGTSITPEVTPKGGGVYVITNVSLFMPGDWELRTSISGSATDHVAPLVTVH